MDVKDLKAQMERGLRSAKYAAKYGVVGFTVPNPIVRKSKEESIDVLMKRFYTMPLPKGGGVVNGRGTNFDDEEGDEEEVDDDVDDLASIGSSHHSTASGAGLVSGAGGRPGSGASSPVPPGTASPAGFRRGFGSPVRTFSQGGLSSVSDASEHGAGAATTSPARGGSKKKAGGADDEDDKEGEGEEEDDGFGSLNISADRLPTDDTALSRFLKRAIVNNGEAAQISGLKSSLEGAISMPRSEEEILADLDKRFYEPEFDPTRAVLESFPSAAEEFNVWVEKQLSEKDIAKDHIMAQLATRVEANYHGLIEGMKNVQEVDLDLTQAGVQCVGSRQKLSIAAHGIRDPLLRILHKRIRRENLQRVANVVKGAHGVLALVKEAKASAAGGRLDRAVGAATEARLAIDGDLLKNVSMIDGVGTALDRLLPELRLDVDKSLRCLCSGKLGAAAGAGGGGGFAAADYAWILRAYLTLDDHGIRLNSKPRGAVSASTLYEPTGEVEDSLAVGIVPIAPTVDRGGVPGLSERIQRFTAMELDYCIKAAIIHAILAAPKSPASASPSATAATAAAAAAMAGTTKTISGAMHSTSPATAAAPQQQHQQQQTATAGSTPASPVAAPPMPAGPEVVKDVHGRIIAFKGRRLHGWPVPELIRMLPAGASTGVLTKLAEGVAEALHRFYCITQWHRSPFDPQNEDPAFLHRPGALNKQKSELAGGLSDDDGDDGEEEEDGEGGVSPSKRKGGNKKRGKEEAGSDEESDDDEEEGGDEGFFDAPAKDKHGASKQMDAAEKVRVAQERKERLERVRLATVARGLKQARKQLWAPVEKAVVALLKEAKEEVTMEGMVQTVATCELLLALGEEFGRNESAALRALLHGKAMALLEKTHQECFAGVKQMLERETWYNVPISVEDLGGLAGVIGNHTRGLAWPALNGWGVLVKDRVLQNATKAAAAASPLALASPAAASPTPAAAPLTVLAHFVSRGNPFAASSKAAPVPAPAPASTSSSNNALLVFDASTITAPPALAPTSSNTPLTSPGGVSSSGSQQPLQPLPKPPVAWAITQAALNGLARFAGRYLQLMRLCPSLALEAYTALMQLLDLYVYAVGAFFVPEPSLRLFLGGGVGLNAEGTVVEELSWANEEVYVPLPCELEGELAALRAYLGAVREDLVEGDDHWEALAAEAASKLKRLGADTAKKLGAFAARQAALNNMMGGGAGRTSPPPATASASGASRGPSPATLPPPIATAGLVRSAGPSPTPAAHERDGNESEEEGGSDGEEGREEGGGKPRKEKKGSAKRLVKRVRVQTPAHVAEALEDPEALFGLSQRAVAVESCAFLVELLRHLQPHALPLLPRRAALGHGNRGPCEAYLDSVAEAVAQLRTLVLRAAAPKLVGAAAAVSAIEGQAWTAAQGGRIREEANAYTEALCGQCAALWAKVGAPQAAQAGGLDCTYIPPQCQLPIWTEACQAAMGALLEGFARVEQCAPEGRALMSMDLQAVQAGLDAVHKARPGRGRVHVDTYVKAYYYGEADLLAWAAQNHKSHFFRHLAGLLACSPAGQRLPKKRLRERILQLGAYYHPPATEEREQGHGHGHGAAGGETPPRSSAGGSSGSSGGGGRSPTAGFASAAASASSFMSSMRSAAAKAAEFKI